MTVFSRFSFHHRIFVLVGLFVVISIGVMWFFIRPLYERQVVEERTTVVQQLQHFAIRSIDEKLEQWINIAQYLGWNLQTRPSDVNVLIRQQIAFDTSLIQIIVSSPELSDEFIATSSSQPTFTFTGSNDSWIVSQRDTSISTLWVNDTSADQLIFGIQKRVLIDAKTIYLTMFADSKYLLRQLDKLPIGGAFAVQVGGKDGFIYRNDSVTFPIVSESWQNLTVMQDVLVQTTEWKILFSKFSAVPMYLLIGIPKEVIIQPVKNLLLYSITIVLSLTSLVVIFGWIFSHQLSKPVTQLVHDVEQLKTLDFSRPITVPKLREIASVAATVESMRTVLERYQRINVEKIIFEEWKNKFFLAHSEDGICITDGNGSFTFMNDRFIQVNDELQKSAPVQNKQELFAHPNIERSKETSREELSGPYRISFTQKEIKVIFMNGEPQYFSLHDVTIDRDTEQLGSLIVLHDLTNDRMIDKMKTEMMNFIVHELRNPLNSIMGFTSFMVDEPDMSLEERMEYTRIIRESSKTMNQLVNRFLDVQRLESRTVDYHKEMTDLVSMAKAVCDSQKPQLAAKSIALTFSAEEGIPHTTVSPELMREAFLNLVSNAIKYGDENRTINVELKQKDDHILFIITDHGYGISAEDQQKLFSKFFRVTSNKKAATQIGTGLGLAHVKEVMTFHKGLVALESNSNIGCKFTLSIPIV
ncbi:MAG: ATP-binding protein [Bacteroidota bacterium]